MSIQSTEVTNYCKSLVESTPLIVYCSGCWRQKMVNPSCMKRNCPRCMGYRSRKLVKRYLEKMIEIDDNKDRDDWRNKWRWLTLTGFRIPVDDKFRQRIRWFGDAAERFLREQYPEAGFMVVEMTASYSVKLLEEVGEGLYLIQKLEGNEPHETHAQASLLTYEKEMYIHAHALTYGHRKFQEQFNRDWGYSLLDASLKNDTGFDVPEDTINEITRFTWMETVRSVPKALRYMMKYILKSTDFTDLELELLKRTKIVRTWGELYGHQAPKMDIICNDCGAKCYVAFFGIEELPASTGELSITLVPRWEENDGG